MSKRQWLIKFQIYPADVQVRGIVDKVANGELWQIEGVIDYKA